MKSNVARHVKQLSLGLVALFAGAPLAISYAEQTIADPNKLDEAVSPHVSSWNRDSSLVTRQTDEIIDVSRRITSTENHVDGLKYWISGAKPLVTIYVPTNNTSRVYFEVLTGWSPNSYGICGVDIPAPTMNLTFARDGQAYAIMNGVTAQGGFPVTTSRGVECKSTFFTSSTNNQSQAPRPGTWSLTVVTTNGSGTNSLALNACTTTALYSKSPMYRVYNDQFTDYYYSRSLSEISAAETYAGYSGRVTAYQAPNTPTDASKPWLAYFGPAPWLEHYYTSNAATGQFVVNAGYISEGSEGYVYTSPVLGAVPLYQFSQYYPATGDLMHHYSKSSTPPAGMSFEEIAGYVCP